jgi:cytochrome b6-f complex iron-sulfur subunit
MTTENGPAAGQLSRRTFLGCAGAVGAAFALAGCTTAPGAQPTAPATTAGGPVPTPTTAGPPGALTELDAVPVGGGVIADGPVLVVRPSADEVKAYDAICPHMRLTVGTPDGSGTITCPGHGAKFRAADGSLISGPPPSGLRKVQVTVNDGFVVRA